MELWKPYEDLGSIFVSNKGRVLSCYGNKPTILKPQKDKRKGRSASSPRVYIDRRKTLGFVKYVTISSLVAESFCKKEGMSGSVFYLDGNSDNVESSNLTYSRYNHKKWDEGTKNKILEVLDKSENTLSKGVSEYLKTGKDIKLNRGVKESSLLMTNYLCKRFRLPKEEIDFIFYDAFMYNLDSLHCYPPINFEGLVYTKMKYLTQDYLRYKGKFVQQNDEDSLGMDLHVTADLYGNHTMWDEI